MVFAFFEAAALFFAAHAEPEFDEVHAAAHQMALKFGSLAHKFVVFGIATKAHDALHARTVVPTAIHQHDFARCGQMLHVTLKIPLTAFLFGRFFQSNNPCATRIQMFHETLNRSAFTGCIAAFKQNHHALTRFFHPRLQFQQFDLQFKFSRLVG